MEIIVEIKNNILKTFGGCVIQILFFRFERKIDRRSRKLGAGHIQLQISKGSLHLLHSKYGLLAFLLSYFRLENKIKLPYEIERMNFDSSAKL